MRKESFLPFMKIDAQNDLFIARIRSRTSSNLLGHAERVNYAGEILFRKFRGEKETFADVSEKRQGGNNVGETNSLFDPQAAKLERFERIYVHARMCV